MPMVRVSNGGTQFDCLVIVDTSPVAHLTDFTGSSWTMQSKNVASTNTFTLQNGKVVSVSNNATGYMQVSITQAGTLYAFGNQSKGGTSPTIREVTCDSSGGNISALYQTTIYAVKFS